MESYEAETRVYLGEFAVDLHARILSKGGQRQPLKGRALAVLLYLAAHKNQDVPSSELIKSVWQGASVTENNLNQHIGRIRGSIGDTKEPYTHLLTVHNVGYRLVANSKPQGASVQGSRATIEQPEPEITDIEIFMGHMPYQFQGIRVAAARLFGRSRQFVTQDRVHVGYTHTTFEKRSEFGEGREAYLKERRNQADKNNRDFFNGPMAALMEWDYKVVDENTVGDETRDLFLEMEPVCWFDFAWLNDHPDHRGKVPREKWDEWLSLSQIKSRPQYLRGSRLANMLDCAITVISNDGFVGYQMRTARNDSVPLRLSSAVAENVGRKLDETNDDGTERLNPLVIAEAVKMQADPLYEPKGKPHPFAAARRGILSELSLDLEAAMRQKALKLSGISYSLESYQPDALFVVAVDRTAKVIKQMFLDAPGDEADEGILEFTKASFLDPDTRALFHNPTWVAAGKASLFRAIELIDAIKKAYRTDFDGAFHVLAE